MSNRRMSWSAALRDLKSDRATRSVVREERLKTPSTAGFPMSCWRGQSGRRYVVSVLPATAAVMDDCDVQDCLIFVARDVDGNARVVGCASSVSPFAARRAEVLRDAIREGATEIHCHRLCESDAERFALVGDLSPSLVFA